ncbi:MAG TPA: phosphotransferase family protein [Acidimicrobiales bacterium]|nr:phosphotransferase family protein [Acidimicrobiales bacterium]
MAEDRSGINEETVVPWLEANVAGLTPPLEFSLIAGGHSNLTYKVTDAVGGAYVLRRPPLGQVLATAHDMGREHRIISALAPTKVPVAPALAYCDDLDVNGAPFYVMRFVEGHIVRDVASAEALSPAQRRTAGESLVDVMADIHAVDPDEVGLGDLGRKEGYIERQLKRWYRQLKDSQTRELPLLDEVHDDLLSNVPEQGPASIVHGDYRLDNCMVDDDGRVNAVLDWEICTLGDPLADLGLLMVYWSDPDDAVNALGTVSATALDGFPRRAELLDRYAAASGRDVSHVDYYMAFGYWKLACIVEGVYARYKGGSMGQQGGFEHFEQQVVRLAESARAAVDRVPRG